MIAPGGWLPTLGPGRPSSVTSAAPPADDAPWNAGSSNLRYDGNRAADCRLSARRGAALGGRRWEPRIAGELDSGSASGLGRESVAAGHRDYRYEGLVVGGLAIGAFGAWVGSQISAACPTEPGVECGPDNRGNAIAVGLVGAAIGGGLGYVVGRLSSKAGPMPPTVEVP